MIVKSFKKCCISNSLDGSEDDVLWNAEDDEERRNEFASDEESYEDSSDESISE